jgi:two-component system, cell cycle sensor histidine kinase and response regulator CckA
MSVALLPAPDSEVDVNLHRTAVLVVVVGFAASFGGLAAHRSPWISLMVGLMATLLAAGLLDVALRRRRETLNLVSELTTKTSQLQDALAHQAQAEQSLRQAQRMEAVGQLAGGIAHDFNNLLQAILSYSEFLSDALDPDSEMQQDVAEVQKAANRAAGLTRQLLLFSRQHMAKPAAVDLNLSLRSAEHLLQSTLGDDIELDCRTTEGPCLVLADSGELELLLTNLALNARDAMPYGGTLTLSVATLNDPPAATGLPPGPFATIEVTDTGEGMTPEVAAKAFEPFFTTKQTGRGTGLGLAMVYGIAKRSGGSASISTVSGSGTTVAVLFPLLSDAPTPLQGNDRMRTTERLAARS